MGDTILTIKIIEYPEDSGRGFRIECDTGEWQHEHCVPVSDIAASPHPRTFLKEVMGRAVYVMPDQVFDLFYKRLCGGVTKKL
jgi:hypothetical protein